MVLVGQRRWVERSETHPGWPQELITWKRQAEQMGIAFALPITTHAYFGFPRKIPTSHNASSRFMKGCQGGIAVP